MAGEDRPPKINFDPHTRISEDFKSWLALIGLAIILFGCFYPHYLVRYIARVSTSATGGDTSYLNGLAWSPDSRQLAFECATISHYGTEREKSYYLMEADGRKVRQLSSPAELPWPAIFQKSAWSPDGRRVAMVEPGPPYGTCRSAIYVADSSEANRRRVHPLIEISLRCPAVMFGIVPITATLSNSSSSDLPGRVEISSGGWPEVEYPFRETRSVIIPAGGSISLNYTVDSRDVIVSLNVSVIADETRQSAACRIRGARPPKILGLLDLTVQQHLWLPLFSGLLGAALSWPWIYAHRRQKRAKLMVVIVIIIFSLSLFFGIGLWRELDQLIATAAV